LPADASNKWIIWYTQSVTGKAHISPSGLVTAIQDGIVIITGVSCDGTNTSDTMAITLSNQVSVDYPIVFETNADTFWSSFANGPYTPDDLTRVSNPDKTGINTSDKVLKFVVNETAERWVGGFSDVYTPITFTDSLNSITMMVYKTVISPTMLKVENSTNGGPVIEVFESNTLINEWELLTFRFPAGIGYTYPCIVVFPDFPEVRTSGTTVYIDNISGPVYTPPYDAPTAVINKAAAGPIIDGTIDAIWSSANTYNIDKPYGLEAPTLGGSGTSWSGLWTEDGIYVLVQVNDDVFFPAYAGANPESGWMYDKPEIWFDVNQILDDGIGPQSGYGHYSIAPEFIETKISGELYFWSDGTQYAFMVNDPGYIAEYFIPFTKLIDKEGFVVPKTATFGFDVTIIDRDIETITRQRAVWSNIGDIDESWINMDDCGTVTLAGADPGILVTDLLISSAGGSTVINTDGGTLQMSAATLPLNATNPEVSWSVSSITGKASINSSGLLTAELSGTVLVTARTTDGSYISSSMEINITNQVMNTAEAANMVYSLIGDGFYLADGVTLASWNYDKDLTYIGTDGNKSTYQLSAQELLTNGMFKIRKDHQWAESYGYDEVTIIGDPTNFVKQDVNIKTINGKTYDIIFIVDWATGDLILSLNPLPPSVITSPVTSVSSGSAVCGGEVISDSGTPVTSRGICWSTNKNPTIANSHTTNGTGKGVFISNITGLNHVTTYYVRAYATNSIGTSYGEELSFHTLSKDATVTSTAFSVDQDALTITGISILENLTSFKGKIVPATGASFEVYKSNGTTVATDLQSGYLLISKAEDGLTTLTYILTVNSGISSEANFISYSISGVNGTINTIAKTISVNLPFGTNVSSLTATFSLSAGASAKVGGIAQISGISTNNFVSPVTYIVTAEDGITAKSWTVSITLESGSSDATVSSTEYAIDNTTKTISNIRTTETLEVFKGLLIPAAGASFQVYQSDGVSLATDLQTGYKVIVIAENGITSNTYTLTVSVTSVASPDATICSGSSTSISLTGYSGTIQWQQSVDGLSAWTNVSGGTGGTSDNYTTANLSSTTFFRAEITSAGSVVSYSNIVKITVEQTPANSGVITGNSLVCPGQKAVTYEVQPINFATSYIWSLPAGMTGISTTNAIEVDIDPSFISGGIEVYGQNSCYSGGASIFVVNVTQMVADAGAISGPTAVCQGEDSVEYSVPEIANASSYIWTLPTGVTGTSLTNKIVAK